MRLVRASRRRRPKLANRTTTESQLNEIELKAKIEFSARAFCEISEGNETAKEREIEDNG